MGRLALYEALHESQTVLLRETSIAVCRFARREATHAFVATGHRCPRVLTRRVQYATHHRLFLDIEQDTVIPPLERAMG